MDFEQKVKVEVLVEGREPELADALEETAAPMFEEEAEQGPVADKAPEQRPDQAALAQWVDDIAEFEADHAGDQELFEAAEKLREVLSDDLTAAELARIHEDRTHVDEQEGFIGNFLVDTALEGAAVGVRTPGDDGDGLFISTASRSASSYIDDDFGGGGGGGGGAGGPPGGGGGPPGDDGSGDAEPPDDKKKPSAPKNEKSPDKPTEKPSEKPSVKPPPKKP